MNNKAMIIFVAENKTSRLFFEDKDDAYKYAGSSGAANGIIVEPISIIPSSKALTALEKPESSEFTETYRKLLEQYGNHPLVEAGFIACAEIDQKDKRIKELEAACEQALSDFRFIKRAMPTSNFDSSTLKLEQALKKGIK